MELICSHSEDDVKIFLLGEESDIRQMAWIRMIPHIQTNEKGRRIGWEEKKQKIS